jgi:hypothetical protein
MRWRKVLLSLFLSFAVVICAVSFGWSIANNDRIDVTIYGLHLSFALYVFVISTRSVFQVTKDEHSDSILHLTALLTIAFLLLGSAAILPRSPSPVVASIDDEPVLLGLWYALLGAYTLGCISAYTTPLGPPLHYPPSDIYSEKTVKSITNTDEQNVCGTTGTCLLYFISSRFALMLYYSRCLSVGHLTILIYDQSCLAWKYCRKPRYWRFTHSSWSDACPL